MDDHREYGSGFPRPEARRRFRERGGATPRSPDSLFRILFASTAALFLLLVSCDGGGDGPFEPDDTPSPDPEVTTVSVSPSEATITEGETQQLEAEVLDQDGSVMTTAVTWSSSDEAVATVDGNGLATGVAEGSAEITATAAGVSGSATLTVEAEEEEAEVTTVSVSPSEATITEGGTQQFEAEVLDQVGDVMEDVEVTWSSSDEAVATVDGNGLATGVAEGSAEITATAAGVSGSATLTVEVEEPPTGPPSISAISPDPVQEGGEATIEGENFSSDPGANTVTFDGEEATVTSASSTQLVVEVPAFNCLPARDVDVRVAVAGQTSDPLSHPLDPAQTPVSLAAGEQQVIRSPSDLCLRFGESGSGEAYLMGIQSTSEAEGLTSVSVVAEEGKGAADAPARILASSVARSSSPTASRPELDSRWARHWEAERELRERERRLLQRLGPGAILTQREAPDPELALASVPGTVEEGDTVRIHVPNVESASLCQNPIEIDAEVRLISEHGIWVTDVDNPDDDPYTDADLQEIAQTFDDQLYSVQVAYFGEPTDLDGNGRGVFVFTKEVNGFGGLAGFAFSGDLADRDQCAASDEGEITYLIVPDPNGTAGGSQKKDDLLADAPRLIAHEFTHMIQFGRRLVVQGHNVPDAWILEGQAVLAEEVAGHAVTGRASGQNLGGSVAWPSHDGTFWYQNGFVDLARYFGWQSGGNKVDGAPERCTWLFGDWGSQGPCLGTRAIYGTPWSLLRWMSDHFGSDFPGGEEEFNREIIDRSGTGFDLLEGLAGEPVEDLLAQWAAMLYVDGRVPGAEERLRLGSWDVFDVFEGPESPTHLALELRPYERAFEAFSDALEVNGASTGYIRISGSSRPDLSIRFRDGADNPLPGFMQLWIVRLE